MKRFFPNPKFIIVVSLCSALLVSCSKNLSRVSTATHREVTPGLDSAALQPTPVIVAKSMVIDTLKNPVSNRISLIISDPYFNQRVATKVHRFYASNGVQTQWLFDYAPGSLYYTAMEQLKNASRYGLAPQDYDVANIEERLRTLYKETSTREQVIDLDIHISEMYFLFTTHLAEGKVRTTYNGRNIWKRVPKMYGTADVDLLLQTQQPDQFVANLAKLQPANEQYTKLQKALDQYRALQQSSESVPPIFVKSAVKPGERNAAIPSIRKKLALTDMKVYPMVLDSLTGALDSIQYDQVLTDAVKFFQFRHGLEPDGVIGDKTLKFLNQSFGEKADVIALNMERMRWLPDGYGENYITVNVPEYKLRVYANQKQEMEMRVIVGASNKPTPIFSDELEHIVFSPTWTVPVSIIKEEIIPHLKKNPEYYADKNFAFYKNEVEIDPATEGWNDDVNPYQYRVVQNPGRDNSLGMVKFMMPNNMSVYLHDTPNHRLFSKDYRALSHGCVRLDEPARFAEYLLKDQKGWTIERIAKAMNEVAPSTIHLKKHYDVHIEYRTAWVDDNGLVNFREDIYGHDKVQLMQLHPEGTWVAAYLGM